MYYDDSLNLARLLSRSEEDLEVIAKAIELWKEATTLTKISGRFSQTRRNNNIEWFWNRFDTVKDLLTSELEKDTEDANVVEQMMCAAGGVELTLSLTVRSKRSTTTFTVTEDADMAYGELIEKV